MAESLRKVSSLEESLEAERVKNRIQQLEIEKLVAVCVRDRERVRAETDGQEATKHEP